eukprot:1382559-Rhodomonas_salina.1
MKGCELGSVEANSQGVRAKLDLELMRLAKIVERGAVKEEEGLVAGQVAGEVTPEELGEVEVRWVRGESS